MPVTSTSSVFSFPRSLSPSKDALKPNPHPYAIKTTSTALLSRSSSSPHYQANTAYHYVPSSPSPTSPTKHGFTRAAKHRYSKSLTDEIPRPLPVPPMKSLRSNSRADILEDDLEATPQRTRRADTLPGAGVAGTFPSYDRMTEEESVVESRGRKRSSTTGNGRVRGMVASLENSSRSVSPLKSYKRGAHNSLSGRERSHSNASSVSMDDFDAIEPPVIQSPVKEPRLLPLPPTYSGQTVTNFSDGYFTPPHMYTPHNTGGSPFIDTSFVQQTLSTHSPRPLPFPPHTGQTFYPNIEVYQPNGENPFNLQAFQPSETYTDGDRVYHSMDSPEVQFVEQDVEIRQPQPRLAIPVGGKVFSDSDSYDSSREEIYETASESSAIPTSLQDNEDRTIIINANVSNEVDSGVFDGESIPFAITRHKEEPSIEELLSEHPVGAAAWEVEIGETIKHVPVEETEPLVSHPEDTQVQDDIPKDTSNTLAPIDVASPKINPERDSSEKNESTSMPRQNGNVPSDTQGAGEGSVKSTRMRARSKHKIHRMAVRDIFGAEDPTTIENDTQNMIELVSKTENNTVDTQQPTIVVHEVAAEESEVFDSREDYALQLKKLQAELELETQRNRRTMGALEDQLSRVETRLKELEARPSVRELLTQSLVRWPLDIVQCLVSSVVLPILNSRTTLSIRNQIGESANRFLGHTPPSSGFRRTRVSANAAQGQRAGTRPDRRRSSMASITLVDTLHNFIRYPAWIFRTHSLQTISVDISRWFSKYREQIFSHELAGRNGYTIMASLGMCALMLRSILRRVMGIRTVHGIE